MGTLARDGIEVQGEVGGEGLALTGFHLGDVSEVQRCPTHDLHIVGSHPEGALRCFAHGGERLGHQLVECLAPRETCPQLCGLAAQFLVTELLEVLFERADGLGDVVQTAKDATFTRAQHLVEWIDHVTSPCLWVLFRSRSVRHYRHTVPCYRSATWHALKNRVGRRCASTMHDASLRYARTTMSLFVSRYIYTQ